MDIKEFLQLIISAGSTIDTLWNTFIGVHFALIAAIYFLNRDFTTMEKCLLIFAYCIFAWLNYGALVSSYQLYDTLVSDAKILDPSSFDKFKLTHSLLMSFNYSTRPKLVMSVHLFALAIVLAVVFLKNRVIRSISARSAA